MQRRNASISPGSIFLQPSINYYLSHLLRQNLDQLCSVVVTAAPIPADSVHDLNVVIRRLYLEPSQIDYIVTELERLALVHQHLLLHEALYESDIQKYEENIFWLLGFKSAHKLDPKKISVVDDRLPVPQTQGRMFCSL